MAVRHGALKTNPVRDVRRVEQGRRRKKVSRALTVTEALTILELFDADEVAVVQDLPDVARYFAGTGNRTGETLAVRWERIDFDGRIAYVDGNLVRINGEGLQINDGKTEMAQRPIPLTAWLVEMLKDRRVRVAAEAGGEQPSSGLESVSPSSWSERVVHAVHLPAHCRHPGHG